MAPLTPHLERLQATFEQRVALVVRRIARLANISMFSVPPWEWSKSHPCASLATHPPFQALLDAHPRHIGFSYECSRTSLEPMVSAHMRGALALTIVREPLARALAAFYHFGVGFQQKPNTTAAKLAWLQKERDSLFQYIRRPADATPAAVSAFLATLPGVTLVQGSVTSSSDCAALLEGCAACLALHGARRTSKWTDALPWTRPEDDDPSHAKQVNYMVRCVRQSKHP